MKITSKGQVTIPIYLREKLGFLPNTKVSFRVEGDALIIEKTETRTPGGALIERMRGRGTVKLTTDQILAQTRGE